MSLDVGKLTVKQLALAMDARRFPVIIQGPRRTAALFLKHKGWGDIENGAGEDLLFRLNQAGSDALAQFNEVYP